MTNCRPLPLSLIMDSSQKPKSMSNSNIFSKNQNYSFLESEQPEAEVYQRLEVTPPRQLAAQVKEQSSPSIEEESLEKPSLLLQMFISIPGKEEDAVLELFEGQDIQEVASNFAREHSLLPEAESQILIALQAAISDSNEEEQNQQQRGDDEFRYDERRQIQISQNIQEEDDEYLVESNQENNEERAYNLKQIMAQYNMSTPTKQIKNPGERLYKLSEKQRRKKEEEISKSKKLELEREEQERSKVLQMNKNSKAIVEKKKKSGQKEEYGGENQIKDFKINLLKQQQIQKELEGCTFVPKINPVSSTLGYFLKQNREKKSVYSNLYYNINKQKKIPQQQKHNIEPECTFQPNTSKSLRFKESIQGSFLERNQEYQQKIKQKSQNRLFFSQNFDESTGRKLFEPNASKQIEESFDEGIEKRKKKQVFQDLFSLSEKKKKQQKGIRFLFLEQKQEEEEEEQRNIKSREIKANEQSSNLVEKARRKRIEEIFNLLDDDNDCLISHQKIGLENLDKELVLQLLPIFQEIDMKQLVLDFEQFYEGVSSFFKDLSLVDKQKFLHRSVDSSCQNHKAPSYSFKPKINRNSLKLVMKNDYLEQLNQKMSQIQQNSEMQDQTSHF